MARLDIDVGAGFTVIGVSCRGARLAPLTKACALNLILREVSRHNLRFVICKGLWAFPPRLPGLRVL
jgi:hypothetical protein